MRVKVTGKENVLKEIENIKDLLDEAGKKLWRLPSELGLDISEGNDEIINADQDNQ